MVYKRIDHRSYRQFVNWNMYIISAGLSDPFCVVRVNNAKKFKTNVAYETLAPVWNESVSIAMPQASDKVNLVSPFPFFYLLMRRSIA